MQPRFHRCYRGQRVRRPTAATPPDHVTDDWVLLAYRMPREPSTPRIAVWRKLRRLGAVQLLDGLVTLPNDVRTKEQLEWIADEIVAAGGDADLWLGRPATRTQQRSLAAQITAGVDADYAAVVEEAGAALHEPVGTQKRTVARLRRELKRIRARDHFESRAFDRATIAVERLADAIAKVAT